MGSAQRESQAHGDQGQKLVLPFVEVRRGAGWIPAWKVLLAKQKRALKRPFQNQDGSATNQNFTVTPTLTERPAPGTAMP